MEESVIVRFYNEEDSPISSEIQVPTSITYKNLLEIIEAKERICLYVHGQQITNSLNDTIKALSLSLENTVPIKTIKELPKAVPALFCNSSLSGHEQAVLRVKIGKNKFYSTSGDGTVRFWSKITKMQEKVIKISDHWVNCIDIADGYIVASTMDGVICVLREDGTIYKNIKNHGSKGIISLKLVSYKDAVIIVSGCRDGKVNICDIEGTSIFNYMHTGPVDEITIFENFIISAGRDRVVKIYETVDYKQFTLKKELRNHVGRINAVKINKKHLLTAGDDYKIYLYSVKDDFKFIREFKHKNVVSSIDISDNGLFLVSGSFDKTVRVWDISTGNCLSTYYHVGPVYKVLFRNNIVISTSKDKTVKTFDIKTKKILSDLVCGDEVFDIDYADNTMICGCRDKKVYFFG